MVVANEAALCFMDWLFTKAYTCFVLAQVSGSPSVFGPGVLPIPPPAAAAVADALADAGAAAAGGLGHPMVLAEVLQTIGRLPLAERGAAVRQLNFLLLSGPSNCDAVLLFSPH